jgi:imidazolonepropionase-like amidohydrolase
MKTIFAGALLMATLSVANIAIATDEPRTLIRHTSVFDGESSELLLDHDVLVEGNLIAAVGRGLEADGATVIDGSGYTLVPGLSDAHVHLTIIDRPEIAIFKNHWGFNGATAAAMAEQMLMRGFTMVRDLGGPVSGLKKAIDEGVVPGPRILGSGPVISQTSGHGDFEITDQYLGDAFPGAPSKQELFGWSNLADGVPEVTKAARLALRTGASQIKVMVGGGVSSPYDPLDASQYSLDELRAIVAEATNWGTYVSVHAFTDDAVNRAIDAGAKSIEHGPFLTEKTLRRMAEEGVWLSPQVFLTALTPEQLGIQGTPMGVKMAKVNENSTRVMELASEIGVEVAWGTDTFGPARQQANQSREFAARRQFFNDIDILRQATSGNARLFALSGERHPYREGPLGLIKPGAYADLLLVKGDPTQDVSVLGEPAANIHLIMKDGVVVKNTLSP